MTKKAAKKKQVGKKASKKKTTAKKAGKEAKASVDESATKPLFRAEAEGTHESQV